MMKQYRIIKHIFGKHLDLAIVFMSNLSEAEAKEKARYLNEHRNSNRTSYEVEEVPNDALEDTVNGTKVK